jgi:DNA-binding beta-propeller fold protein YncE
MRRGCFVACISVLILGMGPAIASAALPATPSGIATGFQTPESMVWDARTGAWYVSNWGGYAFGFSDRDGNGYIAKLEPDATEPEVFATGLDAPQGVTIEGSTMYAADIDHVRIIDMDHPGSQQVITVEGAALGDLDVDPGTGDIYVSDVGANQIWRIHDGTPEAWAEINSPDGVYLFDGGVFIANFALGGDGGVFRIDLATKHVTPVAVIPGATLDGLERDGDGWLVTDFTKGQLLRVSDGGVVSLAAQLPPSSADLGWDPATRTAGVPILLAHAAVFVPA